jgi:hypothetical protein
MKVKFTFKALNEERNIGRVIGSVLVAVSQFESGEIFLGDSLSEDNTATITNRYPVRVVQLRNVATRGRTPVVRSLRGRAKSITQLHLRHQGR